VFEREAKRGKGILGSIPRRAPMRHAESAPPSPESAAAAHGDRHVTPRAILRE
jgi:hypothetical protein